MPLGDILVITDNHKKAAREITDVVLQSFQGEKLSLAIGAESGAGKSEIAHVVAKSLFKSEKKLKAFILHTDDFFALGHKERNELRKSTDLACVGPSEIDVDEISHIVRKFNAGHQMLLPILEFITSSAYKLLVDFENVDVLILEGLYATMFDVTFRIFIDMTHHDTHAFRVARGKEVGSEFRTRVLEKEHEAVSELRNAAHYLLTKDYALQKR